MKRLIPVGVLAIVVIGATVTAVFLFTGDSPENPSSLRGQGALKIQVQDDGFYRIPLADLEEQAAPSTGRQLPDIRLTTGGQPVHYHIEGEDLIFYGRASQSRYSAFRPYILELGQAGPQMGELSVAREGAAVSMVTRTQRLEKNLDYDSRARRPEDGLSARDEPWFWATIQTGERLPLQFDLPELGDAEAMIRIHLWGATHNSQIEPDHDFELVLNRRSLGEIRWDGEAYHTEELTVPSGVLIPGVNVIEIDNSGEGAAPLDIFNLDWFEIEYAALPVADGDRLDFKGVEGELELTGFGNAPAIFEISNPDRPVLLTGWEYAGQVASIALSADMHIFAVGPAGLLSPASIVPLRNSELANPGTQADLIVIAGDEMQEALQPLVAAREEQGLTVAILAPEEIYDEFGDGLAGPDAIASFLRFTFEQWADPAPRYLLIIGEASYDYRGYLGNGPSNQVPSPLIPVSFGGETVSDSRLTDVDADGVPDLAVGRWPVSDSQMVADLVQRTLAYETGEVQSGVIFAADGTSIEFSSLSDRVLAAGLPVSDKVKKLYGQPEGALTDAWAEGAWLVSYAGHGSLDRWGKDDVFSIDGVSALHSTGPPPIVLQLTCLTGFFAHPTATSISEQLLLHPEGPVLLVAATSLTLSSSQEPFGVSFLQELQNPETTRIGDAFLRAKHSLDVTRSLLQEVSDTFGLFGDPSTPIVRPGQAEQTS